MLSKTRAIALHHIKYGESSLIVTLYTEKLGRLTCLAHGVRAKNTRFPVTFFQPLTLLEAEIYHKQNRDIHRLKELNCPFHFSTVPFSIIKSSMALFLAEVLFITLREEESNPTLFDYLFNSFQLLDTKEEGIQNFHLLFLLHFTKYLGFFPADLENINANLSPDLQAFKNLPAEAESWLITMLHTSPASPEKLQLTHALRRCLLDSIVHYYSTHLEGMNRLRSLQVLKEVFF
jgi:DNA repair protein RecO (recombination protein O)